MRKNKRELLAEQRKPKMAARHMNTEDLLKQMLDEEDRIPSKRFINPTQAAVIASKDFVNFYKGPAGCAKTSTIVAAVMMRMITEPGSKGLIARQDYNDLMGTTMARAQSMLDRLPEGTLFDRDKSPPAAWYIRPIPHKRRDGSWDDRPSVIRFMGLKEDLGSYDFNIAVIDEADEVGPQSLNQVLTRMRTKSGAFYSSLPDKPTEDDPDAKDTRGYYQVMLSFNPPEKTHWLYTACTGRDYQEKVIKPPVGRLWEPNPKENVRTLPADYYQRLLSTLPPDQAQRYVDGEWGATFPGVAAIRQFNKKTHASRELEFEQEGTLFRFWDFGYRHPFCIWAQCTRAGNLYILRELMGTDVEITAFARKVKALTQRFYPYAERLQDIGDIAVKQKKDTGSTLGKLLSEGITMFYQQQSIDRGLSLLRKEFSHTIEDEPAIQIDKRYCPILTSALAGGYHMDETGAEPKKDGYYDHPVDTLRYGVVGVLEPKNLTTTVLPDSIAYDPKQDTLFRS